MREYNKKTLAVGEKITKGKYGTGEIVFADEKIIDEKPVQVYHVRFENGAIRHFTAEELT